MLRFLLVVALVLAAVPATGNPESARLRARAYEYLYNLDHAEAQREMEAAVAADPTDIAAERGLAVIAWLQTSYRRGTLMVDEYLGRPTGSDVKTAPPPPDLAAQFDTHLTRALQRAEAAVAERPKDAAAHYEVGAAVGLRASYAATVEGKLLAAFRVARRAFNAHERVLELDPSRLDAGLVVGTYRYIVSTLSLPLRVMAYAAGFGGGKERGIGMIERAAAYSGDGQTEALVALVLIYNRERRYDDALRVIANLQRRYPRNRLLWLEAGATALRAGRAARAEELLADGLARLEGDSRPRMFGEEAHWYMKRGDARRALGRSREAEQDYRRALAGDMREWVRTALQARIKSN
jgi:tetratricopeptide (TPR) repeat protein